LVATGLVVHVLWLHTAPDSTHIKPEITPYDSIETVESRLQYVMVTPLAVEQFGPTYAPRCNILIHGLGYVYEDIFGY